MIADSLLLTETYFHDIHALWLDILFTSKPKSLHKCTPSQVVSLAKILPLHGR